MCWFLLLWIIVHSSYVVYDGLHSYQGKGVIAVILGNEVYEDSSLSPQLKGRVDKAIELYQEGRVRKIMASGGKGNHHVAEGDAMKKYLLLKGIPMKDLIVDNDGINTYHTAKDFLSLDSLKSYAPVIVVSSFFHMTRINIFSKSWGAQKVYGVSSDRFFWQDGYALFREFFAFYKYVIFYGKSV